MKKTTWMAGGLMVMVILSGCGSTVYVQKDKNLDLGKIKTYSLTSAVKNKGDDANKAKINDLTDRKIRESVDKNLEANGWKEVNRNPDVFLVYDVVIEKEDRTVTTPAYSYPFTRWYYNPWGRRWVPVYYPSQFIGYDSNVETIKEGTLTLTMMDASTDKTIWQGWTTSQVNGRRLTDREINSNVKAIIKKLNKQG